MRVLVVKMSSLGDVIHTLPALTDAAAAIPGLRFDWVVEEAFAEIPQWHPAVDRIIPVALRRWRRRPVKALRGPEWKHFRASLGERRYDAVIDAQGLLKSAFVARGVKAPRYGLDRSSARESLASAAYQHRIHVPRDMHAVERIRLLFARSLNYPLPQAQGNYAVREALSPQNAEAPGLLFFHGSARDEKLWPRQYWAELAALAAGQDTPVWLPWGDETERARARWIADQGGHARVLPRLGLAALAQRLLGAAGAVAVDTGLGHLAAALDVPTVSLYGPTSTRLVGAYGGNQVHITSPVSGAGNARRQMNAISVESVWHEVQTFLSRAP